MSRPQPLPNGMAHTEWALRATAGVGLDTELRWQAAVTLVAYVRGVATNLEAQAHAEQDTGLTDEQWVETHEATFHRMMAGGRYPTMAALQESVGLDLDSVFEFGLHRLLDGYAALIDAARPAP
ncbi:TetR/AcrR family transcriptional regulator C-terminal domain-containing protein [Micromonospora sp. NPDC093277]|uniref:TetR/AcrR family transcriptional regulator C-terminal domain-containing protein n=1 Tax=Micromonospora sp. NPDC093277 TaxID=3364291 RepID=UPI003812AB63